MPEIRIAFDLPSFQYAFTWTATEAEAAKLLDAVIAEAGPDPDVALIGALVQAPAILRAGDEAAAMHGARVLLTAWALRQTAGHPEFPGRVIDYLPTHDFEVIITKLERGEASAIIEARARDDFVGSA